MKINKLTKVFSLLSLFLSLAMFTSCSNNDDEMVMQDDIVQTAINTSDLSVLVSALQKTDLVGSLQGNGPFTVFAPTNSAFQALLDSNNAWNTLDDIPVETLKAVLLYHVITAKALSTDLTNNQEISTLNGANLTIDLSTGVKINTGANQSVAVTQADIIAENGVIHIVDQVMLPSELFMSIVAIASNDANFSSLVAALVKTDLVAALQGEGPFTVFAPTNDAFQALLDTKAAWSSLDDVPTEILKSVLLYHVVPAQAFSTDLSNNQDITTLEGGSITVDLSSGVKITTGSGQSVNVTSTDIQASNGVIHVLDQVMLKESLPQDITDLAINTPDLSILVAALVKTDLVAALQADGPYTVFAPTNAAFQALLDSNASWSSLDDIPVETLKSVLLFHVLGNKVLASDLSDTYVNTLATGSNNNSLSLQVEVTGGVEFNGDAKPVTTDIMASNGVVHIIDKVMLPADVVTLALNNAGFTILVDALTDNRHSIDFVSLLKAEGPYTIFAPTNAAFRALLATNPSWHALRDIPIGTIEAVLKYHVLAGANVQSSELVNNQEITMFDGNILTVDLTNGARLKTTSSQTVDISLTDVQGTNGVIHVIDSVLLP